MAWPSKINDERAKAAAARDSRLAGLVFASPVWDALSHQAQQVVLTRRHHPSWGWQETARHLGLTQGVAWGVWRRTMRRKDVQAVLSAGTGDTERAVINAGTTAR